MDTATETQTSGTTGTTATFVSPVNNLRLVEKQGRRRPLGEHGDFENIPGVVHEFTEGRFVESDGEVLDFLRSHPQFGRLFFEQGAEPDRPGGSTAEIHKKIMDLAFDGDYGAIADILVGERTNLSRQDVIAACETALTRANLAVPVKPETPEHEIERLRLGPAAGPQPGAADLVPTETEKGTPAAAPADVTEPTEPPAAPEA
jgi:hypothetical protein